MSAFSFLIALVVFLTAVTLGVLFWFPGDSKKSRRRERKVAPTEDDQQWELTVSRLEKHIVTLRNQIADSERREKQGAKDLQQEKQRNRQLQEKLAQEKSWREKEQSSVDKTLAEEEQLKKDLLKSERELEEEHALRLRQERELTELKWEHDSLNSEKKSFLAKLANLEATLEQYKKEVSELRKANAQLSKETKEINWIAKSEYDKLEMLFKQKEKELERMKREVQET